MAKLGQRDLSRALAELERIGLLLQHDAVLPSFTGVALGESIRGSWWTHPRANDLYDLLQVFRREAGGLSLKLVNGKLTFVAKRLWPALAAVGRGGAGWQRDGLSREAGVLLAYVRRRGAVRGDRIDFVPDVDLPKLLRELERRLLVHVESFHSEAGSHHRLLRSWPRFWTDASYKPPRRPLAGAIGDLQGAVDELAAGRHVRARVPW
jgi:hypothetical protein